MENQTAKHFVLQLGSLASLYLSLSFLLVLLFGIINLMYPDAVEGYYRIESAASSVRLGIAMVVVFFPTYLLLTRMVNKLRRQESSGIYLTLTKWLIYISLLVSGAVLLGDLAVVIMGFLEGELTIRFILKAVAVLVIVGAAFHYYVLDVQGFWFKNEQKSIIYGIAAAVFALAIVAYGFMYIETPAEVRERNLDAKQISDLQDIQYRIESYYSENAQVPSSLNDLPVTSQLPVAPEGREAYTYARTDKGFDLCATFAYPSTPNQFGGPSMFNEQAPIKNGWDWQYAAGGFCFERVVTPSVAPVVPTP